MRRLSIILLMAAFECSEACSWPRGAPSPIIKAVRFSWTCGIILLVALAVSLLLAIRHHRLYGIPAVMVLLFLLSWAAIGSAYSGDCGGTAATTSLFSAILGLAGLNVQKLACRRGKK